MVGKKFRTGLLALLAVAVMVLGMPVWAEAGPYVQIDILTVNDFHGALTEAGKNPGAAKLAGYLLSEKAKNPAGTLIVSAGDMFQGSPDSNLVYGKTVVDIMNSVGFDAMTIGNHEFDWGIDVLEARINQARFPVVAANIMDNATGKPAAFVKPYAMLKKQGLSIAVIGLATPETAYKASPRIVGGYTFTDPAQTVNQLVPELKRQGADIIVVLSHLGGAMDKNDALTGEAADFAAQITGIDAIVTGHSHEAIAAKAQGIPIVQARYNGRAVGKITLIYSGKTKGLLFSTATLTDMNPANLKAAPQVAAIIAAAKAEIDPVKNIALGKTAQTLSHDKHKLSLLGQWSADAMRQAAGADIAFQNGGGLRAGIAAGTVTMGNLYEVMPFDNTLVTIDMTGEQICKTLDYGIKNEKIGMLQYSGVKVKYDTSLPAGRRVAEVTLPDGKLIDPAGHYKVVTNDFMAAGGDGFTMFMDAKNLTDTFIPVRDVLADAFKQQQTVDFRGDDRLMEVWSSTSQVKPAA